MTRAERHLIQRLVAFFATGDSIVANNLVLNLYKHINAPEARMYLSRQLYEEALHVQFYLTLLDTYVPDPAERARGVRRGREHSVDPAKARVLPPLDGLDRRPGPSWRRASDRRRFLLNLICFAACIEGLFFFAAFAYVYFLRSQGPAARPGGGHQLGVPRRERAHGVRVRGRSQTVARARSRSCSTRELRARRSRRCSTRRSSARRSSPRTCSAAASPACRCRTCGSTWSTCADQRLATLGMAPLFRARNPLRFMDLQDVQELTNFFERRVSAYQVAWVWARRRVVLDAAF